jgi:dTDP-4-dehydrorhamnose 3,5-epimerase
MKIIKTKIADLLIFKPKVFEDGRGYFYESFNKEDFRKAGVDLDFVQDNQSLSSKGVLRGLHFQNPPYEQGKLIRVITGSVLDVAVDIRKDSPTYGKWVAVELSAANKLMFWLPPGFAHGFVTLEDKTTFFYKCTGFYSYDHEGGILWNDPDLNIDWKISDPILSEKDKNCGLFRDLESEF